MTKNTQCPRCHSCGQVDVIRQVQIHPDGKRCSYLEAKEKCNYCGGSGFVPTASIPSCLKEAGANR